MTLGGRSDGWVGGLMDVFFTIFCTIDVLANGVLYLLPDGRREKE